MRAEASSKSHKPRELRRKVIAPVRVRYGASSSDACIVNISSRGLMIRSGRPIAPGTLVEVCKGAYAIPARVIWRDGTRTGLKAETAIPVGEIMALPAAPAPALDVLAAPRPRRARSFDASRLRGRAIEFGGVAAVALCLALGAAVMVERSFARPLAVIASALGR